MKTILLTLLALSIIGGSAFATMSTVENDNPAEEQLSKVTPSQDENCGISRDRSSVTFCAKNANYYKDNEEKGVYIDIKSGENIGNIYSSSEDEGNTGTFTLNREDSITLNCPEGYKIPDVLSEEFGRSETEGKYEAYSTENYRNKDKNFYIFTVSNNNNNYERKLDKRGYFIEPSTHPKFEFGHHYKNGRRREMIISCFKS